MAQALPGVSVSTPPTSPGVRTDSGSSAAPFLRVVSPEALTNAENKKRAADAEANKPTALPEDLGAYIRRRWMILRNHRNSNADPMNQRLLRSQRMFNGEYDPQKLAAISEFGGSQVYSRLVAQKARGASALLRDVYFGPERAWEVIAPPDPGVPPEVRANIMHLISIETATLQQAGQPISPDQHMMRFTSLMHAAQQAARRNAMTQATAAANKMEDILQAGGFYTAFAEFLTDLPLFPFAVLKGPVVRMVPTMVWTNGKPTYTSKPTMMWERISPFNFYWTPGVSQVGDAETIERKRMTRADLNDLLGLPGYDEAAVRGALDDYGTGLREWLDAPDTEQALNEGRESPSMNNSSMIDALEYHGNVQGKTLLAQGVNPKLVPDPDRDYMTQSWVVGRHTLKTQIVPNPRQRHPYYVTSFEKVPGTVAGHGLPDILEDLQETANALLRAMVNNLSIASGPQVVINLAQLDAGVNADDLYPWKRWYVNVDPMSQMREPVTFFQPQSIVQELLSTYQAVTNMADDASAIPRYVTGAGVGSGGAGRTASGLGMLMQNASKVLQTVIANIDADILQQALTDLYDLIMLTDRSGLLTGEENVLVRGVRAAMQLETEHQKQLQFLQITGNPIDMQVVGIAGRAKILRALAQGLGLPDDIVPDDQTLADKEKAQGQAALLQQQQQPPPADGKASSPGTPQGAAAAPGTGVVGHSGDPGSSTAPPGAGAPVPSGHPGNMPPAPRPAALSDIAPPVNSFQQRKM